MRKIQKDENGAFVGFIIGCLIYLGLIVFMFLVPLSWAWNGLMNASHIGAGIAYGIALIIFCIITFYVTLIGIIFPVYGADV